MWDQCDRWSDLTDFILQVKLWPEPLPLLLQSQAWPMGPQTPKLGPGLSPNSFSRSTAPLAPWWDTEVTAPDWAPQDHSCTTGEPFCDEHWDLTLMFCKHNSTQSFESLRHKYSNRCLPACQKLGDHLKSCAVLKECQPSAHQLKACSS